MLPDVHIFVKAPASVRVKTRLAASRGEEFAAGLYSAFLDDLRPIASDRRLRTIVRVDPASALGAIGARFPEASIVPQGDGDLGSRLRRAFEESAAKGSRAAIAIGSDSPLLGVRSILRAAELLLRGEAESVIGPARDGGYVLIGFRGDSYHPRVFEEIPWSTENVYEQTIYRLASIGLRVTVLPVSYDVDIDDDLAQLARDLATRRDEAPATARFLAARGLLRESV